MYLRYWLFTRAIMEKNAYNQEKCPVCGNLQKSGLSHCSKNLKAQIFLIFLFILIFGVVTGLLIKAYTYFLEGNLNHIELILISFAEVIAIIMLFISIKSSIYNIRKDKQIIIAKNKQNKR